MALEFWQVIRITILPQVAIIVNSNHMLSTPYVGSSLGEGLTCHPSSSTTCGNVEIRELAYFIGDSSRSLLWSVSRLERRITSSILPYKTVEFNSICHKLVLRESKKMETNDASTSKEEPPHDELDWLDDFDLDDDQGEGTDTTCGPDTTPLPPPSRHLWTTLENLPTRVDHMVHGMEEMRRDQEEMWWSHEVFILYMREHIGFPFDGYTLHYPPPSRLAPRNPPKRDDGET